MNELVIVENANIFDNHLSRKRLNLIGVTQASSISLGYTDERSKPWNKRQSQARANEMAREVYKKVLSDFDVVYLAGRRVAGAFDLGSLDFFTVVTPAYDIESSVSMMWRVLNETSCINSTAVLPIPYPYGLSRWWHREDAISTGRRIIRDLKRRIQPRANWGPKKGK